MVCFRVNSLFVDFVHYTCGVCMFLVLVSRKEMAKPLRSGQNFE